MVLPRLPKGLRSVGARTPADASRLVDEWARGQQDLSRALREGHPSILSRLDALEADVAVLEAAGGGGGGGSFPGYGAHVDLTVGGTGADGTNTTVSRSDHVHGLPAFGDGAGEFCEGDDPRLVDVSDYTYEYAPWADLSEDGPDLSALFPTVWDEGAYLGESHDTDERAYILSGTGDGTNRLAGRYSTVPGTTEWYLMAQVSLSSALSGAGVIGIWAGDLTTPSTGDIFAVQCTCTATGNVSSFSAGLYTAYNAAGPAAGTGGFATWIRLRYDGSILTYDASADGRAWRRVSAQVAGPSLLPHWGVHFRSVTTSALLTGRVHSIYSGSGAGSSDFDYRRPGHKVRYPLA